MQRKKITLLAVDEPRHKTLFLERKNVYNRNNQVRYEIGLSFQNIGLVQNIIPHIERIYQEHW